MYQVSRHTLTQFFSALKRGVHIVNLDLANERVPYPCDISLSDLISVSDVMAELDLGPNGAMLYCMEYLEHNIDWLESRLAALEHDYVLFDLPGQVELSTNHPSLQRILERLQKQDWRVRTLVSPRSWSPFTCRTPRTSQIPRATWRFWCLRCVRCSCSSFHMSMSSANSICSMKSSSRS